MNRIILDKVACSAHRIDYTYHAEGECQRFFHPDQTFFIEYSADVTGVPESMAAIPFVCNVLPIAWVVDAELVVPELDASFAAHIDEIKQGYVDMYPRMTFGGHVTAGKLVENDTPPSEKTAAFFSSGVDAYTTLIRHYDEHPTLVTLYGSDVKLEDTEGWALVKGNVTQAAKEFACDTLFIRSSFRMFLDEGALSAFVQERAGDGWWHGFQHGIGLIGHIAPYAWKEKLKTMYIASSFTAKDKGHVTCASDPTIDNHVHMGTCHTIHDGYELTRQDKVAQICSFHKERKLPIHLHVCWVSEGGDNCCVCEKCCRTIYAIIAEGENPKDYGFRYDDATFHNIERRIRVELLLDAVGIVYWQDIQARFRQHPDRATGPLAWILTADFLKENTGTERKRKLRRQRFTHLKGRIASKVRHLLGN